MTRPEFRPVIDLGNILNAVVVVIGVIALLAVERHRLHNVEDKVRKHSNRISGIAGRVSQLDKQVGVLAEAIKQRNRADDSELRRLSEAVRDMQRIWRYPGDRAP